MSALRIKNRNTPTFEVHQGDAFEVVRELRRKGTIVNMVCTSPPYWGLRDYKVEGQIGLEKTLAEYVHKMVRLFRLIKEILSEDGTVWLNLGDKYNSSNTHTGKADKVDWGIQRVLDAKGNAPGTTKELKPKDLCGIPWRVALALQDDGWYLRQDIIWNKPNCMPEAVDDRCTKAHEYIFLLSKNKDYFYDMDAIREPYDELSMSRYKYPFGGDKNKQLLKDGIRKPMIWMREYKGKAIKDYSSAKAQDPSDTKRRILESMNEGVGRNKRSVWTVHAAPFKGAHFATYPPKLIEPCILAGTSEFGHCPKCHKGWVRVVDKSQQDYSKAVFPFKQADKSKFFGPRADSGKNLPARKITYGGWRPSCECFGKLKKRFIGEVPTYDEEGNVNGSRLIYETVFKSRDGTMPPKVPGVVLDMFAGSFTTGIMAYKHKRSAIMIELNPEYIEIGKKRLRKFKEDFEGVLFK